jgi:hypothetical protein
MKLVLTDFLYVTVGISHLRKFIGWEFLKLNAEENICT